ncbi:MAG: Na/Pi cotransporter family protein [Crocinitomicaceae bacterium]
MTFEILKRSIILIFVCLLGHTAFGGDQFIENISSKGGEGEAKITWNITYDSLPTDKKLVIRYLPSNLTKLDADPDWKYTEILDASITSYTLKKLTVSEKYSFGIGVIQDSPLDKKELGEANIIWSKKKSFKTERSWKLGSGLVMRILMLLGSLALFIYGMKIMSEGIQKAAGQRLRQILGAITKNRLKGIFTGFVTTSIIQSSSATTVMVVSFVNAGLLSLKQSIGVIMGANIGTTVTAWIVAFLGFSVSMSDYALPIMLVAIILMFSNRGNMKSWGEMLVGFAILFIGLELLKSGVPDLKGNVDALSFLKSLSGHGVFSVIIFVLIGTLVTIVVQSSSAAMAITILLCERGIIPFEMAAGMVLGENIGTTITANLAAIVGNVHAKRAARAHFIFNVFGVTWMIIAFPWFIDLIDDLVSQNFVSPIKNQEARPIALALFHTIFNVLNVLLLVWFTPFIARLVIKMVPTKSTSDEEFRLDYIKGGLLATPELFLLEAQKELAKFGKITSKMSRFFQELMFEKDQKKKKKIIARIAKYEEITDQVEQEISGYLSECAANELSSDSGLKVRSMLAVTSELERIGDIFYQMSLTYERKAKEKIWFTPEQRANVKSMLEGVDAAFTVMIDNLNMPYENVTITEAMEKERKVDKMRNKFRKKHLATIEKDDYNIRSAAVYTDLIYSCERVGDHIINVTEALIGKNILGEED